MANKQKIYSDVDTSPIITDILRTNGIEDSKEKFIEKLRTNKELQGIIILKAVEKIVIDGASEINICSFLETGLNISKQISQKVCQDILTKLVPVIKKQTANEESPKKINKSVLPKLDEPKAPRPFRQSRKSDQYREPIE